MGKNPRAASGFCSSLWLITWVLWGPLKALDICFLISETGLIILTVPSPEAAHPNPLQSRDNPLVRR